MYLWYMYIQKRSQVVLVVCACTYVVNVFISEFIIILIFHKFEMGLVPIFSDMRGTTVNTRIPPLIAETLAWHRLITFELIGKCCLVYNQKF